MDPGPGPGGKGKRPGDTRFPLGIRTVRQISQIFFLTLFFWFCITATVGPNWWQLRGWPINWFLELDPLTGLATLLATGTLYKGLIWGVLTLILTLVLGRFFCGWVCPFGAMHQFMGFMGKLGKSRSQLTALNRFHGWQSLKYYMLLFFLASLVAGTLSGNGAPLVVSLLDPIPFVHRFVNLTLLPFADNALLQLSPTARSYDGAWIIGLSGVALLLANLWVPRFFCRFLCPLGALFGFLAPFSFWQIGKKTAPCSHCMKCRFHCEGACDPMEKIRLSECLLCMNCLDQCEYLTYQAARSKGEPAGPGERGIPPQKHAPTEVQGEVRIPDLSRRGFVSAVISGATVIPMMQLSAATGSNWNPYLVRPPGSLPENRFLERCIKCDQCIRACPTNVIQPADLLFGGLAGLWTPALNFRIGSSGCQRHCTACGNVCPTGAILPLELEQRLGSGKYSGSPIRIGTAFVDQGRCLPWAMDRPCIVCQENCPVSPKAIQIKEEFAFIGQSVVLSVTSWADEKITLILDHKKMAPGQYGTGDYYVQGMNPENRYQIIANGQETLTLSKDALKNSTSSTGPEHTPPDFDPVNFQPPDFRTNQGVTLTLRLQRPVINPSTCIGCGVCEHECPVKGKPAIRVTAENESRSRSHVLMG